MGRPKQDSGMLPEEIERIGQVLGNNWWQADMARKSGYSKSAVTRFKTRKKDQSRTIPPAFAHALREEMLRKIEAIAALLTTPSLPDSQTEKTAEMQGLIVRAVRLLQEESRPRQSAILHGEDSVATIG